MSLSSPAVSTTSRTSSSEIVARSPGIVRFSAAAALACASASCTPSPASRRATNAPEKASPVPTGSAVSVSKASWSWTTPSCSASAPLSLRVTTTVPNSHFEARLWAIRRGSPSSCRTLRASRVAVTSTSTAGNSFVNIARARSGSHSFDR